MAHTWRCYSNYLISHFQGTILKPKSIPKFYLKLSQYPVALEPNLNSLRWFQNLILSLRHWGQRQPPWRITLSPHRGALPSLHMPPQLGQKLPSLAPPFTKPTHHFSHYSPHTRPWRHKREQEKPHPSPRAIYSLEEKSDLKYDRTTAKKSLSTRVMQMWRWPTTPGDL